MSTTANESNNQTRYTVQCHCGDVRGTFWADKDHLVAWNCDCSDCLMRGNIHVIIPEQSFSLDMPSFLQLADTDDPAQAEEHRQQQEALEKATTLYEWGTKTAKRRFCKRCGILPWYRPRSNPDGYGITLHCIDLGGNSGPKPQVEIKKLNGKNWEEQFATSDIGRHSKP